MTGEVLWPESLTTRERVEGRLARLLAGLPGSWLLRLIGEAPAVVEGSTLDPHVQFLLAARRRRPPQLLVEPTPEAARRRYRREIQAIAESSGARPTRVRSVRNLQVPGGDGMLDARLYLPPLVDTDTPVPLLLFLHGGGFVLGDLDTHDEPCRILCTEAGIQVLNIAFRLAPEHPFPAPLADACAAMRWAQDHAASLGADPGSVCIGGDSGGGNLAIGASLALAREQRTPAAMLLVYPATDFTADLPSRHTFGEGFLLTAADMDAFATIYVAGDTTRWLDPRASPVRDPDLHLLPPTLVATAEFDPLRDEAVAFTERLCAAGVDVRTRRARGLPHAFMHLTTIAPAARVAAVETAHAFRAMLRETAVRRHRNVATTEARGRT
ncbi:MAG: alpha/beta hydrolase [Gemmatimonadaceae bacterium]|nr:alpha/beta hydrolase [Gemmatimonadaceae bacterium]